MGNRLLTFEGTSIDVAGAPVSNYTTYFSKVSTTLQSPASNGATVATWQSRIATTKASLHATDFNLFLIGGPANNFSNVGTQSAELAAYLSYVAEMRAYADANNLSLKIVASALLPRSSAGSGPTINAYRPTFAASLKARLGLDIDAIVDFSLDSIIGPDAAGNDTTLFSDGLHPTALGRAHMTRLYAIVLDTFINVTNGTRRFRAA